MIKVKNYLLLANKIGNLAAKIQLMREKCNKAGFSNTLNDLLKGNKKNSLSSLTSKVIAEEKCENKKKEEKLMRQFEEFKNQIKALQDKEDNYENSLEKITLKKIQDEKDKMNKQIAKEQLKANQLIKDLQDSKQNNSFKAKERAMKNKMKSLLNQVKKQIADRRSKLLNKLNRAKKMHEVDQKIAAKKILDIKRNLGKKLANMSKKGNPNQCFVKNKQKINDYCNCNFSDLIMKKECKNQDQFCYLCCDNEIGKNNKENLECCYNKCDKVSNSKCDSFTKVFHIASPHLHVVGNHHILHGHHLHHEHHLHHLHHGNHLHHLHHGHHLPHTIVGPHVDLFPAH
jgi:hypothetical protein